MRTTRTGGGARCRGRALRGRTVAGMALLVAIYAAACAVPDRPPRVTESPVAGEVDPFIGTGGHGHTYPGATVPFGMVQVSPDNGRSGWDWTSGYHWSDSVVTGFSHTHLSGTGIGDLLDVLVMPVAGDVDLGVAREPDGTRPWADRLSHDDEAAEPGYYAVTLQQSGIEVELTATPRVGLHRVRYPVGGASEGAGSPGGASGGTVSGGSGGASHGNGASLRALPPNGAPGLVIDLGYAENWDTPTRTELVQVADTLFTGRRYSRGWANDERVYFALATSRPVTAVERAFDSPRTRALLRFGPDADRAPLLVKVAVSY
ncbi:MAG TPA: hypothetical protein VE173_10930, partial [Longimicrobiales bacterium]|nr:hypothetical protein [Longimicrobiales bacterium]